MPVPRSATLISTSPCALLLCVRAAGGRLAGLHRIAAVHHEVEQHLLQLVAVAADRRQRIGQLGGDRHVAVQQVAAHQAQRFLDHVVDVQRWCCDCSLRSIERSRWITASRTVVALHDVGQDLGKLVDARRALRQKALRRLRIAQDGRQRLVQLVGQRSGQLAQHRHPRQVRELVALACRGLFEAPAMR